MSKIQTRLENFYVFEGIVEQVIAPHLDYLGKKWVLIYVKGKTKPLAMRLTRKVVLPVVGEWVSTQAIEGRVWYFNLHRSIVIQEPFGPKYEPPPLSEEESALVREPVIEFLKEREMAFEATYGFPWTERRERGITEADERKIALGIIPQIGPSDIYEQLVVLVPYRDPRVPTGTAFNGLARMGVIHRVAYRKCGREKRHYGVESIWELTAKWRTKLLEVS